MKILPEPITRLIDELNKLPTIGPKTASRLAFYILREPKDDAEALGSRYTRCQRAYNLLFSVLQPQRWRTLHRL